MKRFLFITILLWLASEAVAQRTTTRYLSLGCNIQQVGSSSGKPHVSCNCSDTGGTYDASNIAVGDTLYFNDGGVGYALPIDSIVTPGVPTLVVRADWTGLGLVLVPTGRGGISRSAVNGLKGTIAGLTAADNQYLEEDFVSNISGAISFVSLYKGTTTKFAADTDVAPDTTGAPSTNEIEVWNYTTQDTNWLNSIIFYTGGDDSTAVITYIYFIDSDGNASLLESPSDPLNLTRRIIPSPAFANAAAPLDSEALTFINALSPPALPSTIFVQADGAVPGSGTSDNPETVWVYDGTNVTRIKDFPRKFEVPGSAFSDSTAATGTEVLTWLGSNPQAGNYLMAYHVGSGTVDKPDFAWWIAGDNNVGYSDIVTIKEPGGVADGDKTDIDVSSSGAVWTIDTGVVTSVKILDGTIAWADISAAAQDSARYFDSNRTILRVPTAGTNIGGSTVSDFLNYFYFTPPTITCTLSPTTTVYEVGTSNTIIISGATTNTGAATLSLGHLTQTAPSADTLKSFTSATSYADTISFTPQQGGSGQFNTLAYSFRATQAWVKGAESGTATSTTRSISGVYPVLYGMSATDFTSTGNPYTGLTKLVEAEGNKTVTLTGSGYIYFLVPKTWGDWALSSIIDHNGFNVTASFTASDINISSSGLANNWTTQAYRMYKLNTTTTTSGNAYQFNR